MITTAQMHAAGRALRIRMGSARILRASGGILPPHGTTLANRLHNAGRSVRIALANAAEDDPRAALWHKKMARRDKSEAAYLAALRAALKEAEAHVMWNLEADDMPAEVSAANAAGDILRAVFDLAKFTARVLVLTTKAAKKAITDAADEFNEENGFANDPWSMPDPEVIEQVRRREPFIADAAKEIRDEISRVIEDGIQSGDSAGKIAGDVQTKFADLSDHRAVTIARTETAIAYNNAQLAGMKAKGFKFKEWLTARDEKVRAAHVALDGTVIAIDDTFEVRTKPNEPPDRMSAPCDPRASPGNIINCRCALIASLGPASS